jgi:mRNA interferase RelE/StbE
LVWTVEISDFAERQLKKTAKQTQRRILDYLYDRIEGCKNPRHFGEPLKGNKSGYWRYRIGDYRVIVEIQDSKCVVLAIAIGHRKNIYRL